MFLSLPTSSRFWNAVKLKHAAKSSMLLNQARCCFDIYGKWIYVLIGFAFLIIVGWFSYRHLGSNEEPQPSENEDIQDDIETLHCYSCRQLLTATTLIEPLFLQLPAIVARAHLPRPLTPAFAADSVRIPRPCY